MKRPSFHNSLCTCDGCLAAEAQRKVDNETRWTVRRVCASCRLAVQPSYRHDDCPACGRTLERRELAASGPFRLRARDRKVWRLSDPQGQWDETYHGDGMEPDVELG